MSTIKLFIVTYILYAVIILLKLFVKFWVFDNAIIFSSSWKRDDCALDCACNDGKVIVHGTNIFNLLFTLSIVVFNVASLL